MADETTEVREEIVPTQPTGVLVEDVLVEEVSIDGMCGVY